MGATIVVVVALGLLLVLGLMSWRIALLPRRLLTLIKNERAGDDAQTQALLLEAAAVKIGPLLVGIRTFHEQAAASLRAQLIEAEARARFAEQPRADVAEGDVAQSDACKDLPMSAPLAEPTGAPADAHPDLRLQPNHAAGPEDPGSGAQ